MPTIPSFKISLPKVLWIYSPVLLYLYVIMVKIFGLHWEDNVNREFGIIENATNIFLVLAIIYGFRLLMQTSTIFQKLWFLLLLVGSIYFLGEETSWGQHFLGYKTPEPVEHMNKQGEFNFHNLVGIYNILFNRFPRAVLSNGALFGGGAIPLYFWWKEKEFAPDSINHWIWPSFMTAFTAILANIAGLLRVYQGELKECLLALFVLLYMRTLWNYFSGQGGSAGPKR